ncbi:MAG TPA: NAD(P)/FAD-dependent oxidoreductase [Candidatus Saccharimonadales bacterium]|jgi:NADH dehydrogenase|nr:NAD(P)/FAD-dependent oxidoreductase [Candidatus Saccharimonadales bacterium]
MKRVVVVGSGFGGLEAVTQLDTLFDRNPNVEILLLSDQNYLLFTPLLPQIASSFTDPRHIIQAVREIRGKRKFVFRREMVRAVDTAIRRLTVDSGSIDYDALILAPGSRTEFFNTPGARENSWDYKSLQQGVELREHIIDQCEHADHTLDAATRQTMLTFVIVGGGYTGIELATEMRDFLFRYAAKTYRGISASEIRLIVLEALPDILRGIGPKLAAHARKRLHVSGIEVRTSTRVTRVNKCSVEINGNEMLHADTIIWTAGVRAIELIEALPGPHDRIGRAIVNPQLQLGDHPEVFVIGDSAAAINAQEAPRVAPVAIEQGRVAALNVAHLWKCEPLETYEYASKGMLVSLGMNYAVVNVAGFQVSGYFAWLFWNAVHLYKLVGLKKQVQVAGDWILGLIFPRDAAIVREPKGCNICDKRQ